MSLAIWAGFVVFVLLMIALDLGILHRKSAEISPKKALQWTGFCIVLALLFNVFVYFLYQNHWADFGIASGLSGKDAALQFFTAWVVEQSLSLDNVFVIALIFSYFKIPRQFQHRVLLWGIVGALLMRGTMIALGATLIASFAWIHYAFGALLIYAAIKILTVKEGDLQPEHNLLFRIATSLYPVTKELDGQKFFSVLNGKRAITPLFLVLLVIESTDVLFAVDSIPAVFAITEDPFIVFTSNIFAILNLRSLYFGLSALMDKFKYLKVGLVFILIFVGIKMILAHHYKIPTEITFVVIVGALAGAICYSMIKAAKTAPHIAD
ncbi:MAG: TerC family protein [Deltaproteobacteria bacterium]|nr:TerC family protein [Deltaproteobacteria bacterium]